MSLIKEAVKLTEGPEPKTVADIVKVLNKELKGKTVSAFGKNGKGLWGSHPEVKEYAISKVTSMYHDEDDAEAAKEKGGKVFVSLDIALKGYKHNDHGLIYTDKNFIKSLGPLIKATSVGKYVKDFGYSEQGMQGHDYVNLDVTFMLPKQ